MSWFVIDAVLIMLGCALLGALMAWLLAVALYPTRAEGLALRRSGARAGDGNERDERRAEPYRAEPHRLDDDRDGDGRGVQRDDDDGERPRVSRESRTRDMNARDERTRDDRDGERRSTSAGRSAASAEPVYQTRSELREQARKAGRGGGRR